jgi:hypothetical protein
MLKEGKEPESTTNQTARIVMFGDKELQAKIQEQEEKLRVQESKYVDAIRSSKSYDTLKAIRDDIHDTKQELQTLYVLRDERI